MRIFHRAAKFFSILLAGIALCQSNDVLAERIADISNTKHNFSALGPSTLPTGQQRVVSATSEPQICVFCHTPHAANTAQTPLWNRQLAPGSLSYKTYSSSSIDSSSATNGTLPQPNGISKLCLSCHDGTMAIGAVNVLNGNYTDRNPSTADIAMTGTGTGGTMAPGEGTTTGFTRYLGTDLTNDHPISLRFDANLALKDTDMRDPASVTDIAVRDGTTHPSVDTIVLQPDSGATAGGGLVQCNSCHDPHIRDTTNENIKFLRLNRLQKVAPSIGAFNKVNDIICLACHDKAGWVGSAHANPLVANEVYTNAAADVREFARNTQVWQTACLACHDTHTVQGARRLIREGVDGATISSSSGYTIKQGSGKPAVEEGCFACHGPSRGTLQGQGTAGFEVPDTQTDFSLPRHMPITSNEQAAGQEVHDIGTIKSGDPLQHNTVSTDGLGADFVESADLLGRATLNNRHAECTDCHNPHRVTKKRHFYDNPVNSADAAGTHDHSGTTMHTNIASGVLRGIWGVEPVYPGGSGAAFGTQPSGFDVKRGNPPLSGASTNVSNTYLTREYQLCFKCHSNYAFGNTPPMLGYYAGGTPSGTNGMTQYTNVAMEYQSPSSSSGEVTDSNSGAASNSPAGTDFITNNHRSWHPVMQPTGRDPATRGADANNWLTPWNGYVGAQTMYCTDCHGTNTANGSAIPTGGENGNPWGPHGSSNVFLLKGPWSGDRTTGTGVGQPSHLCFKCHDYNQYGNPATTTIQNSGFSLAGGNMCMMGGGMGGGGMGGGGGMMCMAMPAGMGNGMGMGMNNLHIFHANAVNNFRCNLCHIAVPHGWKNKVFLANLNDTGQEIGNAAGTQVRLNTTSTFTASPYYNRAALKIRQFSHSGNWNDDNCGSAGAPGNGAIGVQWMANSTEACVDVP